MIELFHDGVYLVGGEKIISSKPDADGVLKKILGRDISKERAIEGTIANRIIQSHNHANTKEILELKFDSLTSHDITCVGIIQTAKACGMKEFPVPYVLTNCHNSLCSVGGTINEDDHKFALSAAKKYGGIYVPPNDAVIHSYNREVMASCGKMILGSDSHTRYGALGTMGVGEGGGELVKQLLGENYKMESPKVIAICLEGSPKKGVGPHDVALQIIGKVFKSGLLKNAVAEFVGSGIENLDIDFRNGIDVMTTEMGSWSSIWRTDSSVRRFLKEHNREDGFIQLKPEYVAYYDGAVRVDLSRIKPSIALPFHPSNVYTIEEFKKNTAEILRKVEGDGRSIFKEHDLNFNLNEKIREGEFYVDQGIIAGCSGGSYGNIKEAGDILLSNHRGYDDFSLSVYPESKPVYRALMVGGTLENLVDAGVNIQPAICGPCFGAADIPAAGEFSVRHTTRNYPSREGAKPEEGQVSFVALMDARSIAATAAMGGRLTGADELEFDRSTKEFKYNENIYKKRVYQGFEKKSVSQELKMGGNIKDWPEIDELKDHLLLNVVSVIKDEVTTTDELIPSGETSSFRSDPIRLAKYTLKRKDPLYVERAEKIKNLAEEGFREDTGVYGDLIKKLAGIIGESDLSRITIGSTIFARKPGDGSAREYAASCQKVLGAWGNIADEYANKRYRTNLINWGVIPFLKDDRAEYQIGDWIFIPNIRAKIDSGEEEIIGYLLSENVKEIKLRIDPMTEEEKGTILTGSIINFYRDRMKEK